MKSPMLKMLKSQNPDKEYPSNMGKNGMMMKRKYY